MSNVSRCSVKVRDQRDPKEEVGFALTRLKRKIKDSGIFAEYLESLTFMRPAERRKDKAKKSLARKRAARKRNNLKKQQGEIKTNG